MTKINQSNKNLSFCVNPGRQLEEDMLVEVDEEKWIGAGPKNM